MATDVAHPSLLAARCLAVIAGGALVILLGAWWLALRIAQGGRRSLAMSPAAAHHDAWRVNLFPWE